MTNPLDTVKQWYELTYSSYKTVLYASNIATEGKLSIPPDSRFISLTAQELSDEFRKSNQDLDEMIVVLYWAVFEQNILDYLVTTLKQLKLVRNNSEEMFLNYAVNQAERGNLRGILDLFVKYNIVGSQTVGDVKQVYNFRNWVAHGKREAQPSNVTPITAYQRLTDFLKQSSIV